MRSMETNFDVAIVGAGPAGSSAGVRLAAAGRRVVLVEKEKFPREKLCGEFISPECLEHFSELGVLDAMQAAGGVKITETVFYGRGGRGVAVDSEWFGGVHSAALGLSRAEMDLLLLHRAKEAGVNVLENTSALDLVLEDGRAVGLKLKNSSGDDQGIAANIILDATGRTRTMARKVKSGPGTKARSVAFKTHVRGVDIPDDRCEIFSYRGGYGGTSRVEHGLHNLCFIVSASDVKRMVSDPERVFREVVCSNRRAAFVFRNVEFVGDWLAVPIERFGKADVAPLPGLLTIGDAAAFIDPFTGSGMLLAFESARIAAECIIDTSTAPDLTARYESRYTTAFAKRMRVSSWLRRASFVPFLAELTILGLSVSDGARRRLVRATRPAGMHS
jgi:flavin-dependent dehydrogenase